MPFAEHEGGEHARPLHVPLPSAQGMSLQPGYSQVGSPRICGQGVSAETAPDHKVSHSSPAVQHALGFIVRNFDVLFRGLGSNTDGYNLKTGQKRWPVVPSIMC